MIRKINKCMKSRLLKLVIKKARETTYQITGSRVVKNSWDAVLSNAVKKAWLETYKLKGK